MEKVTYGRQTGSSLVSGLLECAKLDPVTVLPLVLLGTLLLSTNHWFSIQEDEVLIIRNALQPMQDILASFFYGTGQHVHPPLSDLLVHSWLSLTGGSLGWLRLMNIGFYVAGLWFLAKAGGLIAGPSGVPIVLWLGLLWPYGFHFGWILGWFSVSFFLVSALTFAYLHFLESPGIARWLWMLLAALALVWTNYYGWCILGLLAADYGWRHRRAAAGVWLRFAGTLALVVLGFLPLLRAFLNALSTRTGEGGSSLLQIVLYGIWNLYAMFVSESVAPWYFALSVPAGLAVAAIMVLTLLWAPNNARKVLVGFSLLFIGLMVLGVIGTKRVMLIAPWLLLPIGSAYAIVDASRRRLLTGLLLVVAGVGWFGIMSQRYYGTLRFFDPWQEVSASVAREVQSGAGVISYHPSFYFYLTYDLRLPEQGPNWRLQGMLPTVVKHPWIFDPVAWIESGHPTRQTMIYVKGAGFLERQEQAQRAEQWLEVNCQRRDTRGYLPDPDSEVKNRYADPSTGHLPYRIEVREYACAEVGG